MIERYSKEEMRSIWTLNSKFRYFLNVELAVCEAYTEIGKMPKEAFEHIKKTADFNIDRINEIEKEVHHDVIAFLTCVNEYIGPKYSKYMHMGLTSSDIIDTALALQIKDSGKLIIKELDSLISTVKNIAFKYKKTPCLGRSHGIGAEIITFGFKFLNLLDMLLRAKTRILSSIEEISVGQISGPCGTYSNIDTKIEEAVCKKLNLKPAKISTQVISRDRHAYFLNTLALLASSIETFAIEIRHLQRWEVAEVEEGFTKGQKGSSAMPHKRNPIACENLSGIARIIKSNAIASFDNIPLWHERDISHSSVERIVFPDTTELVHYMLIRFNSTLENLVVKPENMLKNISKYGDIIYSQASLLALTKKGKTREEAYKIIQDEAFRAYNENGNFKENIKKYFTPKEMNEIFNEEKYLSNIDKIFSRFE